MSQTLLPARASWPRKALPFVLVLLIFVLPSAGTAAIRSVLLAACLGLTLWIWVKERPTLPPYLWAFAVWALAGVLSAVNASNPGKVLAIAKSEVLYSALVYLSFYFAAAETRFFSLLRRAVASSLAFFGLSAIIGTINAGGNWEPSFYNQLGEYNTFVTLSLPLVLSTILPGTIRAGSAMERWLTAVAIVIAFGGCLFSSSRGIWINLSLVIVFLAVYAYRNHPRRIFLMGSLIVVIGCSALWAAHMASTHRHLSLAQSNARELIYRAAWEHIKEAPIFGHGYGRITSNEYYEAKFGGHIEHTHNVVLSYMDQAGIFGLAAIVALFWPFGRYFFRQVRTSTNPIFAVIGCVLLVSVFLRSMLDMFFYGQNLWLYWAYCGTLMTLCRAQTQTNSNASSAIT